MKISKPPHSFLHLPPMEIFLGIIFIISSFFLKGKTSVMALYFGLGLIVCFASFLLREKVKEVITKKKDPKKTACKQASMVADPNPDRTGYVCEFCDFPYKPCPNKVNK